LKRGRRVEEVGVKIDSREARKNDEAATGSPAVTNCSNLDTAAGSVKAGCVPLLSIRERTRAARGLDGWDLKHSLAHKAASSNRFSSIRAAAILLNNYAASKIF
jgi:hypothetical protein